MPAAVLRSAKADGIAAGGILGVRKSTRNVARNLSFLSRSSRTVRAV